MVDERGEDLGPHLVGLDVEGVRLVHHGAVLEEHGLHHLQRRAVVACAQHRDDAGRLVERVDLHRVADDADHVVAMRVHQLVLARRREDVDVVTVARPGRDRDGLGHLPVDQMLVELDAGRQGVGDGDDRGDLRKRDAVELLAHQVVLHLGVRGRQLVGALGEVLAHLLQQVEALEGGRRGPLLRRSRRSMASVAFMRSSWASAGRVWLAPIDDATAPAGSTQSRNSPTHWRNLPSGSVGPSAPLRSPQWLDPRFVRQDTRSRRADPCLRFRPCRDSSPLKAGSSRRAPVSRSRSSAS